MTENLTLTDFLLARIAEEERRAPMCHEMICGVVVERGTAICTCGNPGRVLTGCEAKREMVAEVEWWASARHKYWDDPAVEAGSDAAIDMLGLLAVTHSDHPDWRPTWAPPRPERPIYDKQAGGVRWPSRKMHFKGW